MMMCGLEVVVVAARILISIILNMFEMYFCLVFHVLPGLFFQEIGTMAGEGHAMVVVRPGSLRETTQVLELCLEAGVAIVPQGGG